MQLPQCEICYTPAISDDEILLVAGGRTPNADYFIALAQSRKIFCIDRGIEICRACNILPKVLIGDFDSANKNALDWAIKNKIQIERHPVDKDFTDTQLAAEVLGKNISAVVTGIFGGRADHLFSNIFTLANYEKFFLADEREIIFYVRGGESVEIKFFQKPFAVSLLPITETCEGVTSENLHWNLSNSTLKQNFPNAVSNRVESTEIKISIGTGTLAIYFCFNNAIYD